MALTVLQSIEFSDRIRTICLVLEALARAQEIPSSSARTLKALLRDIENYLHEIEEEMKNLK